MLGVGWTEMLVIGVVALIFIGPKELPAMMRRVGQFAGTIRRMGQDFQRELNKTTGLNEITNLRNSVTAPLKATADAIRKEFNATMADGSAAPSGAIKPADPKPAGVVDEILAEVGLGPDAESGEEPLIDTGSPAPAAGPTAAPAAAPAPVAMTPGTAAAPVAASAPTASVPAASVPAASATAASATAATPVPRETPAAPQVAPVPAAAKVESAELPPLDTKPKRTRKTVTTEAAPSVETAPSTEVASKPRSRKPAALAAAAEVDAGAAAETKPKRTRSTAKKPAATTTDEG